MTSLRLDWPVLSRDDWQTLIDKCPRSNLFQTWDYGSAVAADEGYRPRRGLFTRERRVVGFVQVFVKNRWGVAAAAKVVRGRCSWRRIRRPLRWRMRSGRSNARFRSGNEQSCN